jgi:hypothetical protein
MPEPNEYWEASDEGRSQKLYAGFCEFASSVVDYCEGRRLLDQGRNSSGRLNWSATASYYSLVHSGRFLLFMAVGDFPTIHSRLARCFDQENRAPEPTDWLTKFPALDYRFGPMATRYSTDVDFQRVHDFWAPFLAGNEATNFLVWFGTVLDRVIDLRNENNYEAILIAHEYRHWEMTEVFQHLATQMQDGARQVIGSMAQWYSAYLAHASSTVKSKPSPPAAEFIATYVAKRIEEPVRDWYSKA